jgi:hypothetical protein
LRGRSARHFLYFDLVCFCGAGHTPFPLLRLGMLLRGRSGQATRYQTAPTLLVAPYYGAEQSGTRGGFTPEFVKRIRHCEYPQYLWDVLPIGGSSESILRLDHVQPISRLANSYEILPYRLSEEAMEIVDTHLAWLLTGNLAVESILADIREGLLDL